MTLEADTPRNVDGPPIPAKDVLDRLIAGDEKIGAAVNTSQAWWSYKRGLYHVVLTVDPAALELS